MLKWKKKLKNKVKQNQYLNQDFLTFVRILGLMQERSKKKAQGYIDYCKDYLGVEVSYTDKDTVVYKYHFSDIKSTNREALCEVKAITTNTEKPYLASN